MPIKKSELYSSLWKSCDELRGSMDASQYKDYVLVLLFVKYISDRYAGQPDALIEVPAGGSFTDMVVLKGDKEIGDKINKIIARLAEANDLKGAIDVADFNNPDKLGRGKEIKTRCRACNPDAHLIWLNLELVKKPAICLEYIIVHEMVHLLERRHNERFVTTMDKFMPQWRLVRDELNQAPLGHATWEY